MGTGVRLSASARPAWAWLAAGALVAAPALLCWPARALALAALSWQPELAWSEPWRWWSAAWVHLSERHLLANLAGALLVAALGAVARLPRSAAWVWLACWPLTHLALLAQPALTRYAGASGVLHAGVAVAAVYLLCGAAPAPADRRTRAIGAAVLGGLVVKVALEAPWRQALIHPPQWDIAIAPLAHASGALWGAAGAALVMAARNRRAARAGTKSHI